MKDGIVGIFCILFSIWVYVLTLGFPQDKRLYKAPAVYPRFLLFLIVILGGILIVRGARQIKAAKSLNNEIPRPNFGKPLIIILGLLGYFILLYIFGFVVATFIFLIGAYHTFGGSLKEGVLFSILLTGGEYLVFGLLLKVPLPQALFW